MPEEIGFHPAATAATNDVARAGRDDIDRAAAANPQASRAAFAKVVHAAASPGRLTALNRGFDRAYASFSRGDWELNTLAMHPIHYVFESGGGEQPMVDLPARLEGPAGYIDGMSAFRAGWGEVTLRSEAVADAGPGRVLNWSRFYLRGAGSGITFDQPAAVLFTWEGEWLVLQQYWWDVDAGTRAAGVDPATLESQL